MLSPFRAFYFLSPLEYPLKIIIFIIEYNIFMDFNKIFDSFNSGSSSTTVEEDNKIWVDFTDTPVYKLGMFKKIIINQKQYKQRIDKVIKEIPQLLPVMLMKGEEVSEQLTFERAWYYIDKFDFKNEGALDALRIFADEYTILACELSISYWEELEEYEKCAHIKKVLDLLKDNVPS